MPEVPGPLRSLIELGVSLARRTASGRVAMARAARVVDEAALPKPLREPVRAELDASYDAIVERIDFKVVEKAAPKAVGSLSKEPIAIAPVAQVHTGELDGEPVAVKVARPGVAATIRGELAILDTMAAPLRMVFPALDVRGVLGEIRESVMDELDLEHEAETQQRVRRALRRVDGVTVPAVHVDECDPGVMVSELLEGSSLADTAPEDPERLAELLITAHLTAWSEVGLALTDPRPSHVLFLGDGEIGLLGTGLARPVDRDRLEPFVAAFAALGADDEAAFGAALAELELLPEESTTEAFALMREVLGEFVEGEATLDAAALCRGSERAVARLGDLLALGARVSPDPADLAAGRMAGQLTATLARFGARANWPELVQACLR